jgi:hypothetical protein
MANLSAVRAATTVLSPFRSVSHAPHRSRGIGELLRDLVLDTTANIG